jgi:hypothetical protein
MDSPGPSIISTNVSKGRQHPNSMKSRYGPNVEESHLCVLTVSMRIGPVYQLGKDSGDV